MNARLAIPFGLLGAVTLATAAGAQAPVVEGSVEVREVGVVVDLPASLRGQGPDLLARRLTVLEGGVERRAMSVGTLRAEGVDSFARVLVVADRVHCDPVVLETAASALGDSAEGLTGLGPVEVLEVGDGLRPRADAGRSSSAAAAALGDVAASGCMAARAGEPSGDVELSDAVLACPGVACLMIWIAPGWGAPPSGGAAPAPGVAVEPFARRLVSAGWLFVSANTRPQDESSNRPRIPDAESRPGSDRHTFGLNLLRRPGEKPLAPEEYERYVDLWASPLRRLVDASAGEMVARADAVAPTLAALAGRSVLWYRTDRRAGGEAVRLEVRERGSAGRHFKAPEWAPHRSR